MIIMPLPITPFRTLKRQEIEIDWVLSPVHKANLGLNLGFWKYANANMNTFVSGPRPREDGDTRRDLCPLIHLQT